MKALRRLRGELLYATYRAGLRRYCFPHDVLTWRWRHRRCCAEQRAIAARILRRLHAEPDPREPR